MAAPQSAFGGGDADYLKENQYATSSNLAARGRIHERFSTSAETVFELLVRQTPWSHARAILDVGCGPGWWWTAAASSVHQDANVTMLDISRGMVHEAVARVSNLGLFGSGVAAQATELPFEDGSFDIVAAHYMLYHVPDPRIALREMRRVLRTSGVLVAATNGPNHMVQLFDVLSAVFGPEVGAFEVNHRFAPLDGAEMLREVFSEVSWFAHVDSLRITATDDALAYLRSFPPGETASDDQIAALRRELEHRVVDGVFHVEKDTGLFVAKSG